MTLDENEPTGELRRALAAYRADMETSRELLWTRIDARLPLHRPGDHPRWTAVVGRRHRARRLAAGLALVAAGFLAAVALQPTWQRLAGRGQGAPATLVRPPSPQPTAAPWNARAANADQALLRALASVDRGLREAEQALSASPDDPYLRGHLAALRTTRDALARAIGA